LQRLPPFAAAGRTHADRHQAVAGSGDGGTHEGQQYTVHRPKDLCAAVSAAPLTASARHELALLTLSSGPFALPGYREAIVKTSADDTTRLRTAPARPTGALWPAG